MSPDILYWWIFPLMLWSMVWKGISLWKCGRNNQLIWFLFILILNTAGILPILYLLFFQKKNKVVSPKPKVVKKPVKKVVKAKPVKAKKKVSKKRKR